MKWGSSHFGVQTTFAVCDALKYFSFNIPLYLAMTCPAHSQYKQCVNPCPATCADLNPAECPEKDVCEEGCECEDGYVEENGICVEITCTVDNCMQTCHNDPCKCCECELGYSSNNGSSKKPIA